LQKDIFNKFKDNPTPDWLLNPDDLGNDKFNPPSSVIEFMKALLNFGNHYMQKSL